MLISNKNIKDYVVRRFKRPSFSIHEMTVSRSTIIEEVTVKQLVVIRGNRIIVPDDWNDPKIEPWYHLIVNFFVMLSNQLSLSKSISFKFYLVDKYCTIQEIIPFVALNRGIVQDLDIINAAILVFNKKLWKDRVTPVYEDVEVPF